MRSPLQRRSGYTLVEVTVACILTALLAILLSTTWQLLMPSTADLIAWGQLFQEMDVAVTAISRDAGGSLPDDGHAGTKAQGLLLQCRKTFDVNGDHFQLCFDGGDPPDGNADWGTPDDTVVDYYVDRDSKTLIRSNQKTGESFTVAKNVDRMDVTPIGATHLQIELTFQYVFPGTVDTPKTLTRKCSLIAKKSP
jgi:type II secretory pathway component PulJ